VNKYWKSLEERENLKIDIQEDRPGEEGNAVLDLLSGDTVNQQASRRDFLKLWGFSFAAAAMAASCERPVHKAIPFLNRPHDLTPGSANYYASTFFDGQEYASLLVKTRDGRPIKLEVNDRSGFGAKGTTARVQASVLGLYDDARYKYPMKNKEQLSWSVADDEIKAKLDEISGRGEKIVLLTSSIISPSTKKVFEIFRRKYRNTEVITYDASSGSAILQANREAFGKACIPSYHFDKADLIVSFGADFLGTWLSPAEYTSQYASRREAGKDMSRHYQFESGMSLSGSNADSRIKIKPSQERLVLADLYNRIARSVGAEYYIAPKSPVNIDTLLSELLASKGQSLVVSGSNDVGVQRIINGINFLLGNYGRTIDLNCTLNTRQGLDTNMKVLIEDMSRGEVGALICHNVNPAFDYPYSENFVDGFSKLGLSISLSCNPDETADHAMYICPDHHFLESWNDAEARNGFYSLAQPVIPPLFDTRQTQDTLLTWAGHKGNFHELIREYWRSELYPDQNKYRRFDNFWNHSLQDGIFEREARERQQPDIRLDGFKEIMEATGRSGNQDDIELHVYESVGLGIGKHANNPWLMELPDPVTKLTWENAACISPGLAGKLGLVTGQLVRINSLIELPVLIQAGQAENTVSVALGYGRSVSGKVANGVGVNVNPLLSGSRERMIGYLDKIQIEPTAEIRQLALTQEHHSMEGREIVRETTLEKYLSDPSSGNEMHEKIEHHHTSLYEEPEFVGHHWALAIDLSKCTGCSSCVIACQTENNIAVVGKQEVQRRRIMHWLRIDRYYSGTPDNPMVYHQPVMCQHCDNAPCENVCPVSATNHSSEGINQMTYNRCIGTKYCINNCPYRVRRFNWFGYVNNKEFDFHQNSRLGKMVLNPDVVVRERGVVEKCSFCVQRIQEKKLEAKLENRTLRDGEINTACAQACPADALVFGDLNNPDSKVSKLFADERNYHLLEELHTLPSVGYLTRVRN
jgi:Fe-S-cluster-containing dehydrogenase component